MSYLAPGVYMLPMISDIKSPRDLREEFLGIQEKFLFEQCDRRLLEEMTYH